MWQIILADLKAVLNKIEEFAAEAGKEIWHIVLNVFKAEEQVIMGELFNMLKDDAIALQNSQPGISSKDMEGILKNNAQMALSKIGVSLAYTAVIATVGTVMHDLNIPDNQGNAGNVTQS